MEPVPKLQVSSDRLVKPGIQPATPGLQGKRFIHYTTVAPVSLDNLNTRQRSYYNVPNSEFLG